MKPVRLRFNGINSFSDETVIDFEPLTKSGLFGIFGDTGSGKSTILDAINFALFGDVKRCGKTGVEYINTKCDECYADFLFNVNTNGSYIEYQIIRRKTRDKKDRNNQGAHSVDLYRRDKDGKMISIASGSKTVDREIPRILGVSEDDFRMCIALPQGEFAQFINAGPTDRSKLIQRLFDLSRYGDPLGKKLSAEAGKANSEFLVLKSQLDGYAGVTNEALEDAKAKHEDAVRKRKDTKVKQDLLSDKIQGLTILDSQHKDLIKVQKQLENLSLKTPEMESLRNDLSVLPACRDVAALRRKADSYSKEIETLSGRQADLDDKIDTADKAQKASQAKLDAGDYDNRISRYSALIAKYDTCNGVPESLMTHQDERDGLLNKQKTTADRIADLKDNLIKDTRQADKDRAAFENYKGDDISAILSDDLKNAILKAGYEDFNAFLESLSGKIRPYGVTESELYALVQGEISTESGILQGRIQAIPEGTQDLAALAKRIRDSQAEKSRLQTKANNSQRTADKTKSDLELANKDAEHILADIRAEEGRITEAKDRLADVYEGRTDYEACQKEAKDGLSKAKREQKRYTDEINGFADTLNDLNTKKAGCGASLREKKSALEDVLTDLQDAIARSDNRTEQECLDIVEKYKSIPNAEDTLKAFDDKITAYTSQMEKLLAVPGVKDYDESSLKTAQRKKNELDADFEQHTKDMTHYGELAEKLADDLKKKQEIEGKYREADHRKALIDELYKLIGGSKFLNFVAEEYLSDISIDASEMLSKLSKGQFWLTYEAKQFVVHDNFDNGAPRSVNTLSGGETFLVSLSLALSLSKIMSGRSDKMIEFFFLDEGFGSLDTRLCDEVVDALETVRANYPDFTIGVISHVEELMQRIENKILVDKATDTHGSTIKMTC